MVAGAALVWLETMLLLNYKPVLHQPTGIGVYANAVLPVLQNFEHVVIPGGGSGGSKQRLRRLAWSQFQLPRLAKQVEADLIFTPAPEGYLGEQVVPQVVMVHDLRPLSHPERSLQSLYFRNWLPPLLRNCKHILVNSNFTASEICSLTGVSANKISVTPLGYDSKHFYALSGHTRLHHRPYFLFVGQAYPHKNLQRLITAFKEIAPRFPEVDLLLVGKSHPTETKRLKQLVLELSLSERVVFKSYAPYSELPNWYRGALALVYPSFWEGFGLPILEAMACGCPVVHSYGSGMDEVSSEQAVRVNPFDGRSIMDGLLYILELDRETTINLSEKGVMHAKTFSWETTRCSVHQVISAII